MAVNEGTIYALDQLNTILGRQWQSREADKDRGMKIAAMKVASDERELDRLNQLVISKEKQVSELETQFEATAGVQRSLDKLEDDTGIVGSDAKGLLEQNKKTLAMDRNGLMSRLNDLNARREKVSSDIASYTSVATELAPELFSKFKGDVKKQGIREGTQIDAEEWKQVQKYMGFDPDSPRTNAIAKSALQASFQKLSKEEFDKAYKERLLDLRGAAISAAANKGTSKDINLKGFIDRYRQRKSSVIGQSKALDLDPDEAIFLPEVDAATTDVVGALESSAHSLANFMGDKIDWSKTSGYIKDLYDDYKSKSEDGKRNEATQVALEMVRELGKPGMIGEELDLDGLFKTYDPAMANYLEESIMALNDLQGFHRGKLFASGINPSLDPYATFQELDSELGGETLSAWEMLQEKIRASEPGMIPGHRPRGDLGGAIKEGGFFQQLLGE
jgi:hypothetical protein